MQHYVDDLIDLLRRNYGLHVGSVFIGAILCADYIAVLARSGMVCRNLLISGCGMDCIGTSSLIARKAKLPALAVYIVSQTPTEH